MVREVTEGDDVSTFVFSNYIQTIRTFNTTALYLKHSVTVFLAFITMLYATFMVGDKENNNDDVLLLCRLIALQYAEKYNTKIVNVYLYIKFDMKLHIYFNS